jgi:hypothetical protein
MSNIFSLYLDMFPYFFQQLTVLEPDSVSWIVSNLIYITFVLDIININERQILQSLWLKMCLVAMRLLMDLDEIIFLLYGTPFIMNFHNLLNPISVTV